MILVECFVILFLLWCIGICIGHTVVCMMMFVNKLFERWWNRENDKSDIFGDN